MQPTFELIHGDCLVELKRLPACSVDVVLTDPPYILATKRIAEAQQQQLEGMS